MVTAEEVRLLHRALDVARRKAREVGASHGRASEQYAAACQAWSDAQVAFNAGRREFGSGSWDRRSGARAPETAIREEGSGSRDIGIREV